MSWQKSAFGVPAMLAIMVTMTAAIPAFGQGFLLPDNPDTPSWRRPPHPIVPPRPPILRPPTPLYKVEKIEIDASINHQVATVMVGQTFKNTSSQTLQVRFVFPLPYDGAVDQMTFLVDGQELAGKLLDAKEAQKRFTDYVRRMEDPALVQWIGSGTYQTQVFPIPPGAKRTVSLRYTQLLRSSGTLTDWWLPLRPAAQNRDSIGEIAIRARITSSLPVSNVYSPTHDTKIDASDPTSVTVKVHQENSSNPSDFRLLWDVVEMPVPMSLVAYRGQSDEDGYFMLLLQPALEPPDQQQAATARRIVIALDKSGSMSGEKIQQARNAVEHLLNQLREDDQFEIITYDGRVESYAGKLVAAIPDRIADATTYTRGILAGGGTNIHESLLQAIQVAEKSQDPAFIVYLTDGQPTVGITNPARIVADAAAANASRSRVLSLGVGYDVNSFLLDKMSAALHGQTVYIPPGDAVDAHVKRLWERIGATVLSDVQLKLTVDGKPGAVREVYPGNLVDLFSGDQMVLVGRYRHGGKLKVELSGELGDASRTFQFNGDLPDAEEIGSRHQFVQRLWAIRRIGSIIDQIDLHGQQDELVEELIALSKKHGVLTPYTAFLADENTSLYDVTAHRSAATRSLQGLQAQTGEYAFRQRAVKQGFQQALREDVSRRFDSNLGGLSADQGYPPQRNAGQAGGIRTQPQTVRPSIAPGRTPVPQVQRPLGPPTDSSASDAAKGTVVEVVRVVGGKTFFNRGGAWIDSELTEQQEATAERIFQFSARYFEFLDQVDNHARQWLAFSEPVALVIANQAVRIEPPSDR